MSLQLLGQHLGRKVVGKQILHRLKAILGRSLKPVEKGLLGVQHREIGGKTWHGASYVRGDSIAGKFDFMRGCVHF